MSGAMLVWLVPPVVIAAVAVTDELAIRRKRARRALEAPPYPDPALLLEAQREVDEMLPGTPPIAPPRPSEWQLQQALGAQNVASAYVAQAAAQQANQQAADPRDCLANLARNWSAAQSVQPPWWRAYGDFESVREDTVRLRRELGGHVVTRLWLEANRGRLSWAIAQLDGDRPPTDAEAEALTPRGQA